MSQTQESPGSNKDYMKFMKKKKDKNENITNMNSTSGYQQREFLENKRKEENSEIIRPGAGSSSDQETLSRIRAKLKAMIKENPTKEDRRPCTILECSTLGGFPEKPSLKQVWKKIRAGRETRVMPSRSEEMSRRKSLLNA